MTIYCLKILGFSGFNYLFDVVDILFRSLIMMHALASLQVWTNWMMLINSQISLSFVVLTLLSILILFMFSIIFYLSFNVEEIKTTASSLEIEGNKLGKIKGGSSVLIGKILSLTSSLAFIGNQKREYWEERLKHRKYTNFQMIFPFQKF